jgi:hypothetical protein
LQNTHGQSTSDNELGQSLRNPPRGFTAKGGRIRDSPTYDSRESGELIEDTPYSPSMHIQVEDLPPPPRQHEVHQVPKPYEDENVSRAKPTRSEARPSVRTPPPPPPNVREGRIVRNHITSPAAPQPSRVSPLAVTKIPRLERIRPNNHNHREPISGPVTPADSGPGTRKRRRDTDTVENIRNVAPRRQLESPEPYIKEEPVSPPPLSTVSHRMIQDEPRRYIEMGPPSPRYAERIVYQSIPDNYSQYDGSVARKISSPGPRRVVSGPAPPVEVYRESDLRRVASTRYLTRQPVSPRPEGSVIPVQAGRPSRAASHFVAQEDLPAVSYRASVQPQRSVYAPDEVRPVSPAVRYSRQVPGDPELIPMAPPPRRIVYDEIGTKYYEAPQADRRASAMPEVRYVQRQPEQPTLSRASTRPEATRIYPDEGYYNRVASPHDTPPNVIGYRSSVQPIARRPTYDPDLEGGYPNRNGYVTVVEYPHERRVERYEDYPRHVESGARMSVRPVDLPYDVASERIHRVQTVQPEQQRFVEVRRDAPPGYVSVRPDAYGRQELIEPHRPNYRYVSTAREMGQPVRSMDGGVIVD